ncbi:MAG: hypothetical protein E6Z14_26290, partial [Klebsiella pneumoniae]|nr:hypothetical protein [Klebsiella pneumoniae]
VTLKMPAFEWVHVQLHQQKGMISLSPPTICNSALNRTPFLLLVILQDGDDRENGKNRTLSVRPVRLRP